MASETKTAGGEVLYATQTSDDDPVVKLYAAYGNLSNPSFSGDKDAAMTAILECGDKSATPQAKQVGRMSVVVHQHQRQSYLPIPFPFVPFPLLDSICRCCALVLCLR